MTEATTRNSSPSPTSKMQMGRYLGPALAMGIYILLPASLDEAVRRTGAAGTLMAVFWITEAIPLAATSLIPLVLFPLLGVLKIDQAAAPFAKPVIFLFLGGFMLAMAVERCGLHRRAALTILQLVGGTPGRLLAGFMAATAFMSMWISNTATVVMMIPISGGLIALLPTNRSESEPTDESRKFELCLLLGIAYSASIGGVGTLVGTPPNALLAGSLEEIGISISFGRWMIFAMPLVVVYLTLLWWLLYQFMLPKKVHSISIDRSVIDQQLQNLGSMTRAEWTVLSVFIATASLWIIREPLQHWDWLIESLPAVGRIKDASISMAAAVALFLLPINKQGDRALDWQTANRLPWGVLILLGGGMSLAAAMNSSGLNAVMADQLQMLQNMPPVLLIGIITGITIFLTEVTSNTATIAALLPVLLGLGTQVTCGPLPLMISAALAASCAFMLPVATAPNAVVFETGRVPMNAMIRCGLWLNLSGIVLIPLLMYFVGCSLLGYPLS